MIKVSLDGVWTLSDSDNKIICSATVPGCNFLDLIENGIIPDPFLECNEKLVQLIGKTDWIYKRTFTLGKEFIEKQNQLIVFDMLDTLAEIYLNGKLLGKTYNAYRQYKFSVSGIAVCGENVLSVTFRSPLPYIKEKQKKLPLPNLTEGEAGSCHIRKPAYHFGWDWAPHLLSCGMTKHVYMQAYDGAFLESVSVRQTHKDGKVILTLTPEISGEKSNIIISYTLTSPDGKAQTFTSGAENISKEIYDPCLWWCNGLGKQNLYSLTATLEGGNSLDYNIGLRSIALDSERDKYGNNFCFVLNGVRIFARGANWVPTDSFISRTEVKDLDRLVFAAKTANMNMLRVWGGGYYESDEFYNLCDKYGILVWQDCMFACSPYPYKNEDFIRETMAEIEYNVKRLRNHPSLALWCGNNEVEAMSAAWCYKIDVLKRAKPFFYKTLPQQIALFDKDTPYHPGSPTGDGYLWHFNNDNNGDTHIWKLWHGMRPPEFLKKRKTRFCSEYGLQSFPHVNTLRRINGGKLPESLNCPVMKVHQKAVLGNSRSLYYVVDRYFTPSVLWDLSYLTQLGQAYCAELATDFWRLNKGRCNGALYWQYNDCWGVTSWAGLDYYGNLKAIQYRARHFNAPVCASIDISRGKITVYAVNDSVDSDDYVLEYGLMSFDGKTVFSNTVSEHIKSQSVYKAGEIKISEKVKISERKKTVAFAKLFDKKGECVSFRTQTLLKENKCAFENPTIRYSTTLEGSLYSVHITTKSFARGVELYLDGIDCAFSDNYFDMCANQTVTVTVNIEAKTKSELDSLLRIRSFYDIRPKHSRFKDLAMKTAVFLQPFNFGNWLYRTFE